MGKAKIGLKKWKQQRKDIGGNIMKKKEINATF